MISSYAELPVLTSEEPSPSSFVLTINDLLVAHPGDAVLHSYIYGRDN
jgi:hypothetical protein